MIPALTFAPYAVTLDGRPVLAHVRAAVVEGRVLLPVRALGNALGADIAYDAALRRIVVQRGSRVATIPARGALRLAGGRAYAPLRSVATAFALAVGYDGRTRTITLDDRRASIAALPARSAPPTATPDAAATNGYALTVTPASGARIHEAYPSISARFAGVSAIDPRTVRMSVDGRDVSAEAAVIGDQVLYTPRGALEQGSHAITIAASASGGAPLAANWSFDDTFSFVSAPPPTPFPVNAIFLDRWVTPGTNAFDVIVRGVPGITGYVGVDGVSGFFPLTVYTADAYVAHVVIPGGVYQPFARVAARLTLPNGTVQTIVLPQRIMLRTATPPTPTPMPVQRVVPTIPRRPITVPSATSPAIASPGPVATHHVRYPLERPHPSPTPQR